MIRAGGAILTELLAAALHFLPSMQPLELLLVDAQFKLLRSHALRPVANDVVVVGFDEASTRALREPLTLWHPHFGKFLEAAAGAGAAAIGMDVVLPDRSFEPIVPGYDRKLLTGILIARRSTPVVLALTVDPSGTTRPLMPAFAAAAGSDGTGYALLPVDSDGSVRRFDEHIEWDGRAVPTLVGQMARRLGRAVGSGLIDFASGPPFQFIPLQTVLAWHEAGDAAQLARAFKGRPVLLGSVLKYEDRLAAPVNLLAWDPDASNLPGVVLHAQALRNLLNDGLVQPAPAWLPFVMALAAALLWFWAPHTGLALLMLLAVWITCLAGSTLALYRGLQLPVAGVMLAATAALSGRQLLEAALGLRERRRLRRAFGGYVSPDVMHEILAGTLTPALGGVKQFGCVMFSDIRGFTTLSEHMTPEQTIAFLNRYFERIVPIIHAHGGTVVSFMGDGIMAVFGVPKPLPNPCAAAFAAAKAMLDYRKRLSVELAAGGQRPQRIGIGLHAGIGVAGHIGAQARHEYSLIGDVTNVAARLEGVTKEVGYGLVCSRAVFEQVGEQERLVPLGQHAIKGHSPVEIFGFDPVDVAEPAESAVVPLAAT